MFNLTLEKQLVELAEEQQDRLLVVVLETLVCGDFTQKIHQD
jgi:hypothetical protein